MERNLASPQFYKLPLTRIGLEAHMDDFHGVGRKSEVGAFLPQLRERLKLKASDAIITGAYEHLKRLRVKTLERAFFSRHMRNMHRTSSRFLGWRAQILSRLQILLKILLNTLRP